MVAMCEAHFYGLKAPFSQPLHMVIDGVENVKEVKK
jgi:hypothetical protein